MSSQEPGCLTAWLAIIGYFVTPLFATAFVYDKMELGRWPGWLAVVSLALIWWTWGYIVYDRIRAERRLRP